MWSAAPARPIELEQTARPVLQDTPLTLHLVESLPSVLDVSAASIPVPVIRYLECALTALVIQWVVTVSNV